MAYTAVTLADLQAQLTSRTEASPWWTAEEARLALNEGLRVWNAATGRWVKKFYGSTVPNDPFVPLPGAISQATRVLWNAVPLEKCSQADLDYGIPNWRGATTATAGHPDHPVYWAPITLTLLVIYPSDAVGLNAVEIAGICQTPLLVNAGDFIDFGQEEHDLLLGYALHVLALKKGGQFLVDSYPGWLAFLQAAAAQNRHFAASAFYRRLLGLDHQGRLRRQERPVTNPVDAVITQVSSGGGG